MLATNQSEIIYMNEKTRIIEKLNEFSLQFYLLCKLIVESMGKLPAEGHVMIYNFLCEISKTLSIHPSKRHMYAEDYSHHYQGICPCMDAIQTKCASIIELIEYILMIFKNFDMSKEYVQMLVSQLMAATSMCEELSKIVSRALIEYIGTPIDYEMHKEKTKSTEGK